MSPSPVRADDTTSYEDWKEANKVIEQFLRELVPGLSEAALRHNAAAVQARLTKCAPPLFVARSTVIYWADSEVPKS